MKPAHDSVKRAGTHFKSPGKDNQEIFKKKHKIVSRKSPFYPEKEGKRFCVEIHSKIN